MDLGGALLAILAGGVVKPVVMVLGVWLLYRLYRATYAPRPESAWIVLPPEHLSEFRMLWWSLVLFGIAEIACAIEVYVLFHSSEVFSGIHSVTSAVAMGLFLLGLYLYFDKKYLRYGQGDCAIKPVCRGCTIRAAAGCKFHLLLGLIAVFVVLSACAAFFAPTARIAADLQPYALPFESWNAWYDNRVVPWLVAHISGYDPSGDTEYVPTSVFFFEFRILPCVVIVLAGAGSVLSWSRSVTLAPGLVAVASGVLVFIYSELALYAATGEALIGSLGHEVAELWFLVALWEFLRRTFPSGGPREARA